MLVRRRKCALVVFAKSTPIDNPETLLRHTENVLKQSEILKSSYGMKIIECIPDKYKQYFWDALSLVCKAHDLGKIQSLFQNKILKACDKSELPPLKGLREVPHNIISPAFIKNHVKMYPKEIQAAIYQAIAFHHGRGSELLNDKAWAVVEDVIKNDIVNRLGELEDMQVLFKFDLRDPSSAYLRKLTHSQTEEEGRFLFDAERVTASS